MNKLILSIFPGLDLLGKGFEEEGFCVVQAQDKIMGGNICNFHPPKNRFDGLIGGSPCQDFCKLNRYPKNNSRLMLDEYCRVVVESNVDWFLHENVLGCPRFSIDGYTVQRFVLDLGWFSENSRARVFTFGSKNGVQLNPRIGKKGYIRNTAITGKDNFSFKEMCEIQGLTEDLNLEQFSLSGKKQMIANAVPLQLSRYLSKLIKNDYYNTESIVLSNDDFLANKCACGCGRKVYGRKKTSSSACRKRLSRFKMLNNDLQ